MSLYGITLYVSFEILFRHADLGDLTPALDSRFLLR